MTSTEQVGAWIAPPDRGWYPGVTVASTSLARGDVLGMVCIQDYGERTKGGRYRVGKFLPGITECSPGDTPKTWPEESWWVDGGGHAYELLLQYHREALYAGWVPYLP